MKSRSIPIAAQRPRPEAVGREQVDPGEHPHQVVDPERQDQEQEHEPLTGRHVAPRSTRPGSRSGARARARASTKTNVRTKTVRNGPPCQMFSQRGEHVADVPVERVPERHRLRERVLVAERDGDDGVEGEQEEDGQPRDAGEREQPPRPARAHPSAGLELRPGLVPVALARHAQLEQLLVEGELVGTDDGAGEALRDQAAPRSGTSAVIAFCGGVAPT